MVAFAFSLPWLHRTVVPSHHHVPLRVVVGSSCSQSKYPFWRKRQPTKALSYLESSASKEDTSTPHSETLLSLGLDIHTKSIGFAIVSGWTGQAIRHGMIHLQHMEGADAFDKVDYVREQLVHLKVDTEQLYKEFIGVNKDISWVVGVEAYLFRFLIGQSRAVSLFGLAELNTLISYECRWIFQRRPFKFHASKARSWLGLSQKKQNTQKDIKQIVFDHVHPFLLGFETRYRPRSKAFCSTNFDISDAYVAARYAIRLEEEKQLLEEYPVVKTSNHSSTRTRRKTVERDKQLETTIEAQLLRLEKERIQRSHSEVGHRLNCFVQCHGTNK
ncbi:hypothetical protein GpartN1_g1894.t1 [Galdieria partita]|uniref:Uncharacterized protein n=1 Tax=Galdieria partita TaxID=83374 RepID=A0A9C7UNR4_9RHOD|nr:hypothetical protein GpartN1_g1894.t1 [Galdieria partita]